MLNDTQCRKARPRHKSYKLTDGKGLYLEIKPNGKKVWRYRFELSGRESIFTIGEYTQAPTYEAPQKAQIRRDGRGFSLAEAREERIKARALVKNHINPAHQRKLDRIKKTHENATTFEAVATEWITLKDWEQVTKDRRLAMLKRVVFPHIGQLPVRQVTPAHVLHILKVTAKTGPTVAQEAKRTMSGIFRLAVSTLRADMDPVSPVRDALPVNKTQHKKPLTPAEVGQLMRDLERYHGNFQTLAAFKFMWLTLCRPSEAIEAEWSEIDLGVGRWTISTRRMKGRRQHISPLSKQAVTLLRSMETLSGKLVHVFPNRDDRHQPMTVNTMRQGLKVLGWSGRYSPHATRTTGSTLLNGMGYSGDWIERQLAHVESNKVRGTYNQALYIPERMKMMQHWADILDAWRDGADVISLAGSASN